MIQTDLRSGDLPTLVAMLNEHREIRHDYVVPSSQMTMRDGQLVIAGKGAVAMDETGVSAGDLALACTDIFDEGFASRLDVPIRYVRKLRSAVAADERYIEEHEAGTLDARHMQLIDDTFNVWMAETRTSHLIRTFHGDDESFGLARAILSQRFGCMDDLDVLLAALAGVKAAGVDIAVRSCDRTERRMRVRIEAPELTVAAPTFLKNYRSPFSGQSGADLPLISAGLAIDNSETGGGATNISPSFTVLVCKNGMTATKDGFRRVHLGGKMAEGIVDWSADTIRKNVDLITAQARDAVETFLNVDFLRTAVAQLEEQAGAPVTDPVETIKQVAKRFSFSEDEQALILADFIAGGDVSAGGVMQAVTSTAQRVESPERAAVLEDSAFDVLSMVAG